MIKKLGLAGIMIQTLSGCVAVTPMHGTDGEKSLYVNCKNFGMNACYHKANQLCPSGYYLIDQKTEQSGFVATPSVFGMTANAVTQSSIVIRCK